MTDASTNRVLPGDLSNFLIANSVLIVIFLIGLYLQIQIIILSKREKNVTWRIDICNSIVMIFFYSFRISFEVITHFIPILHPYTGRWFCYLALFINMFGAISVISHSMIVSVYKYIYIVHNGLVRYIGVNKISIASMWFSLFLPVMLTLMFVMRPTIPSYSSIYNCLGMEVEKSIHVNESSAIKVKRLLFCGFDDFSVMEYGLMDYFINIINIMGCFISILVVVVIIANIIEALLYYKIFSFIQRYFPTYISLFN